MKVILHAFLAAFFLVSCTTLKIENTDYEKDLQPRVAPYSNCFAIVAFTLNYTEQKCFPIIKINNSYLLLDSGASNTYVGKKALKDLFQIDFETFVNQHGSITEDGNIHTFDSCVGFWNIPSYEGGRKQIPFYASNFSFSLFDGIIGQDAFRQFSNIIIDYKNKVIVFDGEPINGDEIPMIIDEQGLCFIDLLLNGKKETCLIDTGADVFILRGSFFEKDCNYNYSKLEQIEKLKERKVELTPPHNYLFKNVKIGNVKYKKITGLLASDSRIQMTPEARARLSEYSSLGFPFFKDKIIQLDYKNQVFRISK